MNIIESRFDFSERGQEILVNSQAAFLDFAPEITSGVECILVEKIRQFSESFESFLRKLIQLQQRWKCNFQDEKKTVPCHFRVLIPAIY